MTAAVNVAPADGRFVSDFAGCDFSFEITSEALPFTGPGLRDIAPVERYIKAYESDPDELVAAAGPDAALFAARLDGRLAGYIALSKTWNGFAEVDDIAVDSNARRAGVARALMDRAVLWARERGLPGIRLETQSNNVAACRFHERYGFELAGYDRHLYSALTPGTHEIALFWYLRFA
ncbi:GNAT family N-acetyltransferase [Ensifer sp. PDNC004]|uniref:GNAT family N-acetyltransferase n=1 Tax=Ensifer sp. PDNC004 TaxID=2811423 RepID=UPI00196493F1|nr:GNAT family N-acetyltransferase [Ensifer sp. PDNC004]QRY67564.1 GNAT family N-acetyltransferase [Ensifer sp. PDNC004]